MRREVPYRKFAKGPRKAKRLVFWKAVPGGHRAAENGAFQGVVKNDFLEKVQAKIPERNTDKRTAFKRPRHKLVENPPVDVHKKAGNVEPKHAAVFSEKLTRRTQEPESPPNAEKSPFPFAATVSIIDETSFKEQVGPVPERWRTMLAKGRRDYLPLDLFFVNEANGRRGFVFAAFEISHKGEEVRFGVALEFELAFRTPFVAVRIEVGPTKLRQRVLQRTDIALPLLLSFVFRSVSS